MKKLYDLVYRRSVWLIVLTALVISSISLGIIQGGIVPQVKELASMHVDQKEKEIDAFIEKNKQSLRYLAGFLETIPMDAEHDQEILRVLQTFQKNSETQYESLGYITINGMKHVTGNEVFNVSDRDYFKELQTNEYVITDPFISRSNKEKIILMITRIYDEEHHVKGYVSGALTVSYLQEVLDSLGDIHFSGRIVTNDETILFGKETKPKNVYEIRRQIPSNPKWTFVLEVPKNYLTKDIYKAMALIIIATGLMILLCSMLSKSFAKQIEEPVESLDCVMKQSKEGKLVPLHMNSNIEEFNSLSSSYNVMIEDIQSLLQQVKESERIKNQANNRAMFASIKPHFLYNTLETISTMAYDNEDEEVEEAINNLATLFRIGLSDDREIITLEEEILHVSSYLAIQELRYGDMCSYQLELHDVNKDIPFMKFVIQPLVENAIYHGVKLLEKPSTITIAIYKEGSDVIVDVCNVYETMDYDLIHRLNTRLQNNCVNEFEEGYGLFNVNNRLKYHFGNVYGIELIAKDHVFISRVRHPIMKGEDL